MGKGSNSAGGQVGTIGLTINSLEGWLWDAACSIRGAVDAPKFKDYILPLIFVKRLSDVFDDEIDRLAKKFGDRDTALELAADDHSLVRFYIPPEASWSEVRKLTTKIGQRLTEIIRAITKANPSLQGVIDIVDFNATVSGQRIIEDGRLSTLIEILSRHPLGLKDVEPDILGRAYEYLLRKFAEGQGSSAGEFFTPQEVGWLIARLLRPAEGMTIYDPACGSGGLLVKAELVVKEATPKLKKPMHLYGQELNHVTYAIAKMNMIIHDMEGEVAIGDTLRNPKFLNGSKVQTFDLVAANPFPFGYPSAASADWAWVQHVVASLNDSGRAVIVLDTGAAGRGSAGQASNREKDIRKQFIDHDLIEGVIQLPENLFYNTASPGILLCLNRRKSAALRGKVIVVNAAAQFRKGRPKNFIPDEGIEAIVRSYEAGVDVDDFVRVVTKSDIELNDYNISPSLYVGATSPGTALTVGDALVLLRDSEEARRAADLELDRVLQALGWRGHDG